MTDPDTTIYIDYLESDGSQQNFSGPAAVLRALTFGILYIAADGTETMFPWSRVLKLGSAPGILSEYWLGI